MGIAVLAVVEKDLRLMFELGTLLNAPDFSTLRVARSFQQAVQYLQGAGIYSNRHLYPSPTVLLLDPANPHGIDLHLLEWLRGSLEYQAVPVGILSDSTWSSAPSLHLDPQTFIVDRSRREAILNHILAIGISQREAELAREARCSGAFFGRGRTLQKIRTSTQCYCR